MKSTLWLRIASVLTLVHAALHTVGGVFGKPLPGPATAAVDAMKANHFVAFGVLRTFFDYYRGMGLAVSIFLTVDAIAFWVMAGIARQDADRLRPLMATFLVAYLAMAVNSYEYFFLAPVIVEFLIVACLGLAWFAAGNRALDHQSQPSMAAR